MRPPDSATYACNPTSYTSTGNHEWSCLPEFILWRILKEVMLQQYSEALKQALRKIRLDWKHGAKIQGPDSWNLFSPSKMRHKTVLMIRPLKLCSENNASAKSKVQCVNEWTNYAL